MILPDWNNLGPLVDQFTLNFEKLEENKNGFLCIRPQSIACLDERVDGFVVFKSISDPRYLQDPESYETKLLSDYSGLVVKEPAVAPCFMNDIDKLEEAEEQYPMGNCDRVFEELRVRVADHGIDKARKFRYTVIKFPDGMKGSNLYFNKKSAGHRKETKFNLDTNPRFIQQEFDGGNGIKFDYVTTYVYWKIAVDGSQRSANEKKTGSALDDLLNEAIKGMKRTSIQK